MLAFEVLRAFEIVEPSNLAEGSIVLAPQASFNEPHSRLRTER